MNNEKSDNAKRRQHDFFIAVNQLFTQYPQLHLKQLCFIAATNIQAPQFYVSPKHALEVYRYLQLNNTLPQLSPPIKCMYYDLFRLLKQPTLQDMEKAILSPAPSFYIEPTSALNYYYRAIKNRHK